MRAAEGLAADEDPGADADLGEYADEVVEIAGDALPVLGESGEVGLVVGVDGEPREPGGDLARNRDLRPAQVRSPEERPCLRLDDARDRQGDAHRDEIVGGDGVERPLCHPGEPVQHGRRPRAAVVRVHVLLVPDRAGQVLDANCEVVHVHLEADGDDPVAELERLRRPPHPTASGRPLPSPGAGRAR